MDHVSVLEGIGLSRWLCLQGPSCSKPECGWEGVVHVDESVHRVCTGNTMWLGSTPHTYSKPASARSGRPRQNLIPNREQFLNFSLYNGLGSLLSLHLRGQP